MERRRFFPGVGIEEEENYCACEDDDDTYQDADDEFDEEARSWAHHDASTMERVAAKLTAEELLKTCAHDILLRDVMHCGFLYKKAQDRRVDVLGEVGEQVGRVLGFQDRSRRWQLRYVIIYQHYVLYFRDDKAKKPQGVFSLTGYNRVMRDEAVSDDRKWSFKIIGLRSDARTWYFNAASEKEMKLWMAYFKVAMEQAIHGKAREKSLKILQDLKYKNSHRETIIEDDGSRHSGSSSGSTGGSNDPLVYEDIEMPLYDDTASPASPTSPHSPAQRPLPSLPPAMDDFKNPRRSSAGARSGISKPVFPTATCPIDTPDSQDCDEDYITPDMDSSSPQLSRPLPPPPKALPSHHAHPLGGQGPPLGMGGMMTPLKQSIQQAVENRKRREVNSSSKRLTTRQASIDEGIEEEKPGLRRGPEGNSFRKGITEKPHLPAEPMARPPVSAKPSDAGRPATRPKPKIATKPATKPKPVSTLPPPLLPESASIQSADKVYTEGLLRKHRCDGMYLVRLGSEQGQVLMVWDQQNMRCKHYKIFQDQDNNLHLDHVPKFDHIIRMLEYYKLNALPNSQLYLQRPYMG